MTSCNQKILEQLRGGLIVSCQALKSEPLYSSYIMGRMAFAAFEGGAVGIRANTPEDIAEIKKTVELPVIGLYKVDYPDSGIYITPTMQEVDALVAAGPEIIAMDATDRLRPEGKPLSDFFREVRAKYPDQLFMADTASFEEGRLAQELGFDLVGTTMSGYTPATEGTSLPNYELMERYVKELDIPVVAEGGIWYPEQLKQAMDLGVWTAVVGTAITRPRDITKRFTAAIRP
ncbi:MAG: N-acetylmannosamine-6-phosphate 2-epimerase [Oscillospiraceae bacterium]|jgi:N-acylglucosamine-6-phosphate 2-epimerase|nr:N-acetylmannosamine-6-phosphate 2-epimerase [Oscillospiraceae bacterium]